MDEKKERKKRGGGGWKGVGLERGRGEEWVMGGMKSWGRERKGWICIRVGFQIRRYQTQDTL